LVLPPIQSNVSRTQNKVDCGVEGDKRGVKAEKGGWWTSNRNKRKTKKGI